MIPGRDDARGPPPLSRPIPPQRPLPGQGRDNRGYSPPPPLRAERERSPLPPEGMRPRQRRPYPEDDMEMFEHGDRRLDRDPYDDPRPPIRRDIDEYGEGKRRRFQDDNYMSRGELACPCIVLM